MNFTQSWHALNESVKQFNDSVIDFQNSGQIQKITSTLHFVILRVRYPGTTRYLYIGRGRKFEGLYDFNKNIEAKYRVVDKFVNYLRKYLVDSRIQGLTCYSNDRILILDYQSTNYSGRFAFFWKGGRLYFSNTFKEGEDYYLFKSWNQKIVRVNGIELEHFNELNFSNLPLSFFEDKEFKLGDFNDYLSFLCELYKGNKLKKKMQKKAERKEERINKDLQKVKNWIEIKKIIEMPGCDLSSLNELVIKDIRVKFSKNMSHYQKLDLVYEKIKKLKKGSEILEKRLKQTNQEVSKLIHSSEVQEQPYAPIAPVWKVDRPLKADQKVQKLEIDLFQCNNLRIGVGLTAKGNDQLRSIFASKEDWWFHLDGLKSAHVVIRCQDMGQVTPETLKLIASILKEYSGLKDEKIPMIYTQVKNVKGVRGSPGKVIYKRIKFVTIWYDDKWKVKCIPLQESDK